MYSNKRTSEFFINKKIIYEWHLGIKNNLKLKWNLWKYRKLNNIDKK